MASKINTQKPHSEMFTVEAIRPLIGSFFQQIRSDQLSLLLRGEPDFTTKTLLAELLLEITHACARSILGYLEATQLQMSEEVVSAAIADSLPHSFAEALELRDHDQVSCDSAEQLKSLIVKEVVESIKSSSSSEDSLKAAPRVTSPARLNKMLNAAVTMIKGSMERLSGTSIRSRRSDTMSKQSVSAVKSLKILESLRSDLSSLKSTDSLETTSKKVVRNIIREAVNEFTVPLTDTLMQDSYEEMEKRISEEIENISSHVSSIMEARQSTQEEPPKQRAAKWSLMGLAAKVKAFFTRQFAKASIFRIWGKFEKKSHKDLRTESRESVQAIVEAVDSLLEILPDAEIDEEVCYLDIPEGKTLHFTKALTDLLYERATEIVPTQMSSTDALYVDIRHRVGLFLALVSWWMSTQSGPYSRQVLQALTDSESRQEVLAPWVELPLTPETVVEEPVNTTKAYVASAVNRTVARAFRKAELDYSYDALQRNFKWLVEQVWSQLKDEDINVMSDRFEELHKSILRDLVKKWGRLNHVLVLLDQQSPQISACIAESIRHHLNKKRSAISGFFSTLGKVLSKPFRRSH